MTAPPQSPVEVVAPLRLSVLDQSPVAEGSTGAQALQRTLELARLADRLGYHRFWVAEHHGTPMLAGAAPEVLIGPIAATTSRIRVGSGGVMLHHYSPRKVAESFSVLGGLFPGRIDLGLGRGADADAVTTHALQRDRRVPDPQDYPDQLAEVAAYLDDRPPPDHRFASLAALPGLPCRPQPWLLGSSLESAIWAGQLGLPYAFGDFINPAGAEVARLYRETFTRSQRLPCPLVAVCVAAICADTDDQAERLASSARLCARMAHRGTPIPVPPVEQALRGLEEAEEPAILPRRMVLGSPATVRAGLEAVAGEYGADEVIVVTITHSHAERRRSYELIAEAFRLGGGEAVAKGARATASASPGVGRPRVERLPASGLPTPCCSRVGDDWEGKRGQVYTVRSLHIAREEPQMTVGEAVPTCSCSSPGGEAPPEPAEGRIEEIVRFHGHMCPGLAMGIRAAEVALREIGPHSSDEEVVALVETDMCAVDAIQFLTGCTFGKGNLIHLDHGKNAYTFIRRSDDKAIRVAARPGALSWDPERRELFEKVQAKTASDAEWARFQELQRSRSQEVLEAPEEKIHTVEEVELPEVPPRARIRASVTCAECGEPTMESRILRLEGRALCPACFEAARAARA